MENKANKIYSLCFTVFSFIISYYFFQYYVNGDQTDYIDFYNNVTRFNIIDGYRYYNSRLGAGEPVYFLFVYSLSPLFNKIFLFSITNAVLAFYLSKSLLRLNMSPYLLMLIALNFYLLVLFLAAERLKLSLTFFIIGLNALHRSKKLFFFGLTLLSHFQASLMIITLFTRIFTSMVRNFFLGKFSTKSFRIIYLVFIGGALFYFFQEILVRKITGYNESFSGINNVLKPLAFCLLTLLYTNNRRLEAVIMHLPIIIGSYFLGDLRMTIFSFFIFMYFGVQYKRGLNVGVIASLVYFFIQGIVFLQKVIKHGEGFFIN